MKFSGFRILKSLKIAFLQIFRIQDPESSGSGDPAGKSQEGQNCHKLKVNFFSLKNGNSLQIYALERSFAKNCQNCQRSFSLFIMVNPVPKNPGIPGFGKIPSRKIPGLKILIPLGPAADLAGSSFQLVKQ